ncbi:MAG: hypothetical protein K2U26_03310 [Cyclobacteriaceae bacterium]|nr:hypothetical protein [Cyclobacteriaceae bacterium]
MDSEREFIDKCLQQIENKLGWGPSSKWQNQDFEALGERILAETKVSLSASTLKRVWGKVRHEGSPTLATLNALAQFIGYENWRAFSFDAAPTKPHSSTAKPLTSPLKRISKSVWVILVIGFAVVLLWSIQSRPKKLSYQNISFTSKPVTKGLPNTVVFQYNAKDSNADSVFIQQNWNPDRRFNVEKEKTEFTSTYYTPGYFRAKLILDSTIVKEHDLFIESEGWMATIDREPIPIYVPRNKIYKNDTLFIDSKFLEEQQIDLEKENLWTSFYRVVENEAVPSDAFSMSVDVKSSFAKGASVCQHVRIVLLATDGVMVIPLSIKGCVGELGLMVGEKFVDGKTNDLSAFGVDFSVWANVRCEVRDGQVTIIVNDKVAYEDAFKSIGKIVGTRILFMGSGEVTNYSLKKV